jgi:uncharacterized protein YdeI (YjbR/CyaY-like superfamily)
MATPPTSLPLLEVRDRAELREWLEANHSVSGGVRLVVGKKGSPTDGSVTELRYAEAVEEALCFGWIDSTTSSLDAERYALRFTPRKPRSVWARSNKERVERLTAAGLMRPAGLAAVETAKANGSWNSIDDVESLAVPGDLACALDAHPQARAFFDALPPGQRKLTLHWVVSAKRPETRERRIKQIVSAAADGHRVP